jgi:acyl dehydratase
MTARRRFDDVTVGDSLPPLTVSLRRPDLVRYAGASGDFNVIHWNERAARAAGLPDVIAHGMLTMAVAGRVVTDWAKDPAAVVEYGTKFPALVVVPDDDGATVEVSAVVTAADEATRTVKVDITATSGSAKVLGKARAICALA